jgi:hypothetical protein
LPTFRFTSSFEAEIQQVTAHGEQWGPNEASENQGTLNNETGAIDFAGQQPPQRRAPVIKREPYTR